MCTWRCEQSFWARLACLFPLMPESQSCRAPGEESAAAICLRSLDIKAVKDCS